MKRIWILAVAVLLLSALACRLPWAPAATENALPTRDRQTTSTSIPLPTDTPTRVEIASPTTAPETPPPAATPAIQSQPAAPAHYHAGDAIQLDEIHMMTLIDGWGIVGQYVLVTADGGVTWSEVTPPESLAEGARNKAYGTFLDKQTAWVIFSSDDQIRPEASVWHTADGGQTWTPSQPLFHQAFGDVVWAELAAFDATHVWLLVRGVYVGAGTHFNAQFLQSVDGGITWTAPYNGDVNWDYTGMVFADADHGILTWQTTGAYVSWPPEYALTADGGATWKSGELPPPADTPDLFDQSPYCETYQPTLLSPRSIRLLVGCIDYEYPLQEFTNYLYASEDGGSTWEITKLPDLVLAGSPTLIFFDAQSALLLGREIYFSADGGLTWAKVKSVNWDGQFSFVNPQTGWAVARANGEIALVKTVNGGSTWIEIKPTIK